MKLTSVNVGRPRTVVLDGEEMFSGILKQPVTVSVRVLSNNLEGDGQGDPDSHGGTLKAVYGYPQEHYAYWAEQLDRDDLAPGLFGENLTTEGALEGDVHIGDIYRVGTALLQVTQPRKPCSKLSRRLERRDFARQFMASGRLGFYMRVLEQGKLNQGDAMSLEQRSSHGLTVHHIWHLVTQSHSEEDESRLESALQLSTLQEEWRAPLARRAQQSR